MAHVRWRPRLSRGVAICNSNTAYRDGIYRLCRDVQLLSLKIHKCDTGDQKSDERRSRKRPGWDRTMGSKTVTVPGTMHADWHRSLSCSGAWREALRDIQERFAQVASTAADYGLPDLLLQLPLDFHLLLVQGQDGAHLFAVLLLQAAARAHEESHRDPGNCHQRPECDCEVLVLNDHALGLCDLPLCLGFFSGLLLLVLSCLRLVRLRGGVGL
mmetsp:Transcript_64788/g.148437  ORF Transcript_64788/g.148437 Transcript_64788/m.148437 type:complete len:214 (-) Transcript_64788:628-1269(-)